MPYGVGDFKTTLFFKVGKLEFQVLRWLLLILFSSFKSELDPLHPTPLKLVGANFRKKILFRLNPVPPPFICDETKKLCVHQDTELDISETDFSRQKHMQCHRMSHNRLRREAITT